MRWYYEKENDPFSASFYFVSGSCYFYNMPADVFLPYKESGKSGLCQFNIPNTYGHIHYNYTILYRFIYGI